MERVDYFRLQAKNLKRDLGTKKLEEDGIYSHEPKYFDDIEDLIMSYDIDEEAYTLMKCQHVIANLAGFSKWADLINASDEALELGELLLKNRNAFYMPLLEDWQMYLAMNGFSDWDDSTKLELFKAVYLNQ